MTAFRCLAGLVLVGAVFAGLSPTQDTRQERPIDPEFETWQDFGRLAALIHALPEWNDQEDLTPEQWKQLADLGCAFQGLRDSEIETALITFMNVYQAKADKTDGGRTKPLLLLRMMFDTSHRTKHATDQHGRQWRKRGYQPMGGFDWHGIPFTSEWDLDGMPVKWTNGQPSLGARRFVGRVSGRTGPPIHSYQPHRDFRYLRDMYQPRDLSTLASATKIKWQDLAKAAKLFADDPWMNR